MAYPISAGIELSLNGTDWYKLTDHNRKELQVNAEVIESAKRMANGKMRKYVVAQKTKLSTNWSYVPSKSSLTVDGNKSSAWLDSFYDANVGLPIYLKLVSGGIDNAPSASTIKAQGTAIAKETKICTNQGKLSYISGLLPNKSYGVYLVFKDPAGNESIVNSLYFKTKSIDDRVKPSLSNFISFSKTTTSVKIAFTPSQFSTYYYLVKASGDPAPTAEDIKAQGTAIKKGTGLTTLATSIIPITGLTAETTYDSYFISVNSNNQVSNVYKHIFATLSGSDATPPTLSNEQISNITDDSVAVSFSSNEEGTYYYLVLSATDATPTAATIKAQGTAVAKGSGIVSSSLIADPNIFIATGLIKNTNYKVHAIVEDASGNQSSVLTLSFTTLSEDYVDVSVPTIDQFFITNTASTGAVLNIVPNEIGTYYYVVYETSENTSTPTGQIPNDDIFKTSVVGYKIYSVFITDYSSTIIHRTIDCDYATMNIEFTEI